jgi:hypothetical protein
MYFFNGHGETVKPSHGNSYITLEAGQFVIMNTAPRLTKGSAWIQDLIWSNILLSANPYQFVESIHENIHNNKYVPISNDIFGYFGSFGSRPDNMICPNITLESEYDWIPRGKVAYSERFGLFKVPITIDNDKLLSLREKNPTIRDSILIGKVSKNDKTGEMNREQEELVGNKVTYIEESTDLDSIIHMLKLEGITKFVIFCNVCRDFEYDERREYSKESMKIAFPLTWLLSEMTDNPDGMRELAPIDASMAKKIATAKPYIPIDDAMAKKMATAKPFIPSSTSYKEKYLKYKTKYLELKKELGSK